MELDLLIRSGTVLTLDPRRPTATWIGLWNGRVVGLDDDVSALPARRRLDLGDCTIVPGLRDAHCHTTSVGVVKQHLDLSEATSTATAMDRLAVHSRRQGGVDPVVGFGWAFDTADRPHHSDLDVAADSRPVLLVHRSGHQCVVSTELLRRLEPRLGALDDRFVGRDGSGAPTGVLSESAMDEAKALLGVGRTKDLVAAIDDATSAYLGLGLTGYTEAGIGCPGLDHSPVEVGVYQRAREEGRLHVRATLMVYSELLRELGAHPDDDSGRGLDLGIRTHLGDPWLRVGAMKLWADGAGSSDGSAELVDDPEVLRSRIISAHRAGWQVAVHAMGDAAVDLVLESLEQAGPVAEVRRRRHRIEHAAVVRPDQIPRMAALGVVAVVQPVFLSSFGDLLCPAGGSVDPADVIRTRSLLESGVVVAASSDAPVADASPLAGLAALTSRRTPTGRLLGAGERLTAYEGLRCYTTHAAYADHLETQCGTVAPRMLADLTVLSDDPRSADPDTLSVVATMVDGRVAASHRLDQIAPDPIPLEAADE